MAIEPGSSLGQYEMVAQIGSGGMGAVWKAFDTSLKRHVAIKILPARLTADPEWRQRFQREAEAAAALDHPNIAVIHQVGEQDGKPFIVMQLLDGRTLRRLLRERRVTAKEWLAIGTGIADGLAHAQKNGIVHRDLKPDNVMITSDHQVKILDFGLAKVLGSEDLPAPRSESAGSGEVSAELTRVGRVLGSRSYMSPEQARGETIDHRSDLFALGVLLYEMAGGRVPFRGKTDKEILTAISNEEPLPLSELVDELPAEVERVVRKAMEKEPERRYQHADELATDLRNLKRDLARERTAMTSGEGSGSVAAEARRRSGRPGRRSLAYAGIAAAIVALSVFAVLKFRPSPDAATGATLEGASAPAKFERAMIVVLPFENLGPAEDEYFATGMSEEIIGRLATVDGLGVISRKSAVRYAETVKTIKEIGRELDVDYVLEGAVRWGRSTDGPSRVRITPQLIRVSDDTTVWAEVYDEVIDDIFSVQSLIAEKVIDHVGVALSGQRFGGQIEPTDDLDAYRSYMRGLHQFQLPDYTEENFRLQVELFERAIDLDPDFGLAHAALSRTHSGLYHFGLDRTPERQALAKRSVDRALELMPDSPDAHFALGNYYYWCHQDYDRALEAFAFVRERMPSKLEVLEFVGFIRRRQGRWPEAVANLERASQLNPVEPELRAEIGSTYNFMRRYDDAERSLDRAIALLPHQSSAYVEKVYTHWLEGGLDDARATLEALGPSDDPSLGWYWFRQEIYERRFDDALRRLQASPTELISYFRAVRPKSLMIAEIHDLAGRPGPAAEAYAEARDRLEQEIAGHPDDYRLYSALGLALAGLGIKSDAIRSGSKAVQLYPISRDAVFGPQAVEALALIYARVGEDELALDQLEQLLAIPSLVSGPLLRLDPRFERLRRLPRFAVLAEPGS